MFTLVVFTLVTGTATPNSFSEAFNDVDEFGGGYQVRAGTSAGAPIDNMRAALRRAPGLDPADFPAVGSQSVLAVKASQVGTGRPAESTSSAALDGAFLEQTTFGLGAMARGYASARMSGTRSRRARGWRSSTHRRPRRDNWNFAVPSGLPAERLLHGGRGLRPDPDRGARPADRASTSGSR